MSWLFVRFATRNEKVETTKYESDEREQFDLMSSPLGAAAHQRRNKTFIFSFQISMYFLLRCGRVSRSYVCWYGKRYVTAMREEKRQKT